MNHQFGFILTDVNKRTLLFVNRNPQSELHLHLPSKVLYFSIFDVLGFKPNIDTSVLIENVVCC
jgi:hypothetical protein